MQVVEVHGEKPQGSGVIPPAVDLQEFGVNLAIVHRYFNVVRHLPCEQAQQFVTLDYHRDMALVGLAPYEGCKCLVAGGTTSPRTSDGGSDAGHHS